MDLPFELFIAVRYLLARRKQAFISLISLISVLGVAVGVMALLIALALMTGLQGELRDRLVGSTAHVYVFKAGGLQGSGRRHQAAAQAFRDVVGAAPVLLGQGLIQSATPGLADPGQGHPAGARDDRHQRRQVDAGRQPRGARPPPPTVRSGIVLGKDLADKLNVVRWRHVRIVTAQETLTPFGHHAAHARVQGRRHLQAGALRVRLGLRLRASGRARNRCCGRTRPISSSCGSATCSRRRRLPRRHSVDHRVRLHRRRTGRR